ncbi:MAG: methionine ABC transporter ATP-binding protein [Ezakiella sp.]
MIEAKNLTKEYHVDGQRFKAVDNVSFEVDKGDIFAIIGLSGAGKSTLVRLLNRLEEPDEGNVFIDGVDIMSLREKELLEIRKRIAFIFQNFNLFNQYSVLENVMYPLNLTNKKIDKKKAAQEVLDYVGLISKEKAYPKELSGGQRQRVAIARALVTRPEIILSDEATSALDPESTRIITDLYKRARDDFETTTIMITHQMEVAKDTSNKIAVMEKGRIIESNSTVELFRSPKSKLAQSFVKKAAPSNIIDISSFEGVVKRLSYTKRTVNTPVLNDTIKKFDVNINLIEGNINNISDDQVGYMIVEFKGEDAEIFKALQFLKEHNVEISEVL